jgi:hypothetical protein
MSVPQQVLIEAVRKRCEQLEQRYPGYVTDLVVYLAEVLSIERSQPKNVVQQVEAQLEAFGDLYRRRSSEGTVL